MATECESGRRDEMHACSRFFPTLLILGVQFVKDDALRISCYDYLVGKRIGDGFTDRCSDSNLLFGACHKRRWGAAAQ